MRSTYSHKINIPILLASPRGGEASPLTLSPFPPTTHTCRSIPLNCIGLSTSPMRRSNHPDATQSYCFRLNLGIYSSSTRCSNHPETRQSYCYNPGQSVEAAANHPNASQANRTVTAWSLAYLSVVDSRGNHPEASQSCRKCLNLGLSEAAVAATPTQNIILPYS